MSSTSYLTVSDLEAKLRAFGEMPQARIGISCARDNLLQLEVLHPDNKEVSSVIGYVQLGGEVEVRSVTGFLFWKWVHNMVLILAVSCVLGMGAALAVFFFRLTAGIFGLG